MEDWQAFISVVNLRELFSHPWSLAWCSLQVFAVNGFELGGKQCNNRHTLCCSSPAPRPNVEFSLVLTGPVSTKGMFSRLFLK